VLGIESSCDETAAAIVEDGHLVLSSRIATQIEIHRRYGGVVPELASRSHVLDLVPVVEDALHDAGLGFDDLDAIAVTQGPGLVGALLVGLQAAKAIAYARRKPLLPVHHLAGHLHAVFLHRAGEPAPVGPAFPHVALCVSGGHTAIYRVHAPGRAAMLATTRDDAAGEAFDKVARLLDLPFPGGPAIDACAVDGDPAAIAFPRALSGDTLDFSFSGLKTAVLRWLAAQSGAVRRADVAASFQEAVVDVLSARAIEACRRTGIDQLVVGGGVAANSRLRALVTERAEGAGVRLRIPRPGLCTDNGAMVAALGARLVRTGQPPSPWDFPATSSMAVGEIAR
jgi:N6-L-threonylcarbamoyladenine synthase